MENWLNANLQQIHTGTASCLNQAPLFNWIDDYMMHQIVIFEENNEDLVVLDEKESNWWW